MNASRGYIRVRDAKQLHRDGSPTGRVLPEVMIDEDAISLIAQGEAPPPDETPRPLPRRPPLAGTHKGVWDTGAGSDGTPAITFGESPCASRADSCCTPPGTR